MALQHVGNKFQAAEEQPPPAMSQAYQYCLAVQSLKMTAKQVKQMAKRDYIELVDKLTQSIAEATIADKPRQAWAVVRTLLSIGGKSKWKAGDIVPALKRKHGQLAGDPLETARIELDHFADIEAGITRSQQDTIDHHNAARGIESHFLEPKMSLIPTLQATQLAFAAAKTNVAPDRQTRFVQRSPCSSTGTMRQTILHPLLTKITLRTQEPWEHKGALAFRLWKGKGDAADIATHRSIILGCTIAKHHHRLLRSNYAMMLNTFYLATQAGDRKGQSTAFPSLQIRSTTDQIHNTAFQLHRPTNPDMLHRPQVRILLGPQRSCHTTQTRHGRSGGTH